MDWELIWWLAVGGIATVLFIVMLLPINWDYKEHDPYENCPKEGDEW